MKVLQPLAWEGNLVLAYDVSMKRSIYGAKLDLCVVKDATSALVKIIVWASFYARLASSFAVLL